MLRTSSDYIAKDNNLLVGYSYDKEDLKSVEGDISMTTRKSTIEKSKKKKKNATKEAKDDQSFNIAVQGSMQ